MSRLIDADELLDRVEWANTNPLIDHGKVAVELIHAAPTIDAAPVKHGRWIPVDWREPRRYGCSECHRMVWQLENFCPNCGADMRGEEEDG